MAEVEKGPLSSHKRTAVSLGGLQLALLTFQTLGIIYSDIGTSPLYTLNAIWPAGGDVPSNEDIIGGLSAIIWSITLLPLVKYVFICLQFGTHEGEGGTFALFQGLFPSTPDDFDADRTLTGDSGDYTRDHSKGGRKLGERAKWPLLTWCLFGTSLTIADGIFTPAVSVTSAVAGIAVAQPSVINDVIPVSIAILVVLFLGQQFGTAKIGMLFSPVACIWFALLAVTGAYNISFYPGVFRAFDPSRAILWFVRTGNYDLLGGVLLAVTGCEAVFANLGHFNASSIRISFCFLVYPSLALAYLGQGAALITNGEYVLNNVFYNSIPGPQGSGPLFWIMFVVAILATIIASQAMITGTFSLIQQIVSMKSLPPIRLMYTSETIQGQVYIPLVNYTVMIACIIVVAAFQSSSALTNAYGFSVATVMFSTTWLVAIQMYYVKGWPLIAGLAFLICFGFFDGLFWGAALKKVPQGAWVPLMIGVILMVLMLFWTWARGLEDKFDSSNRHNLRHFIHVDEDNSKLTINVMKDNLAREPTIESHRDEEVISALPSFANNGADAEKPHLTYYISKHERYQEEGEPVEDRRELVRIPTCAVFHKLTVGKGVPHSFVGFVRQWPAIPQIVIFLAVAVLPINRVSEDERYVVEKVRSVEGFYGCTYYLGFRDTFDVKVEDLVEKICALEVRACPPAQLKSRLESIRKIAATTTHMVPHYTVVSKRTREGRLGAISNWIRRFMIESLYQRLSTMFPETMNWKTSADQIIHVGINADI